MPVLMENWFVRPQDGHTNWSWPGAQLAAEICTKPRQPPHCTVSAADAATTGLLWPGLPPYDVGGGGADVGGGGAGGCTTTGVAARLFLQQQHQTKHPTPSKKPKVPTTAPMAKATLSSDSRSDSEMDDPEAVDPEAVDGYQMQNWSSQRVDVHPSQPKQQSEAVTM
mmetsp:Transcript_23053/g.65526  ORF Transcript_23053/g.65526 Transcript_23053/m.65526 type:complete len:167 (-) Transcript_23053:102-602(-)